MLVWRGHTDGRTSVGHLAEVYRLYMLLQVFSLF